MGWSRGKMANWQRADAQKMEEKEKRKIEFVVGGCSKIDIERVGENGEK